MMHPFGRSLRRGCAQGGSVRVRFRRCACGASRIPDGGVCSSFRRGRVRFRNSGRKARPARAGFCCRATGWLHAAAAGYSGRCKACRRCAAAAPAAVKPAEPPRSAEPVPKAAPFVFDFDDAPVERPASRPGQPGSTASPLYSAADAPTVAFTPAALQADAPTTAFTPVKPDAPAPAAAPQPAPPKMAAQPAPGGPCRTYGKGKRHRCGCIQRFGGG